MKKETILNNKEKLLGFAPDIANYNDVFKALNRRWNCAITAGMIEAGRMDQDAARLFGPLIEDMRQTKEQYGHTQKRLVDAILVEMSKNIVSQIIDAAKFTINILKRNLFERTADVGYLATDSEIVNFLKNAETRAPDSDAQEFIRSRLAEYQYEYTVYNDILILDTRGRILARLDQDDRTVTSEALLLKQTMDIDPGRPDQYLETYAQTDLFQTNEKRLIYSQKINDPESGTPLGILCLSFNLEDEARRIFTDLSRGNSSIISAVLDEEGQVMFSSNTAALPRGSRIPVDTRADFRLMNCNGRTCMVSTLPTEGYQGFFGLTWYGMAMIPTQAAFSRSHDKSLSDRDTSQDLQQFSEELAFLRKESNDLLGAMKIDSINGEVQAAKFRAQAFVKVLHFVKEIGEDINGLFSEAIENLQQTIASSLFTEVEFRAFQGNNIADRNLYERANDVCWWALTPLFRTLLEKGEKTALDEAELSALRKNLQYINDLYTPYLRILLADTSGRIIAVSDPPEGLEEHLTAEDLPTGQAFVGTQVDPALLKKALSLSSSKDYCVSEFQTTPLYGGRHTYIYSTCVRAARDNGRPVGVIQIVFDSEPQFKAMLSDVLPRDENNDIVTGSFALFSDRDKNVIASTSPDYPPGSVLPLDSALFDRARNERDSMIVTLNDRSYALGLQVSDGYREYKTNDGYDNDVISMVLVPI